jgi:hypothetical protein
MKFFGSWLGRLSQIWLSRFQKRYGLSSNPNPRSDPDARVLLHVACGGASIAHIPLQGFQNQVWHELRLDADTSVHPDVVGSMVDMSSVADGFADALFSSHGIEHLYWHDVPLALAEFRRTLKDSGFAIITCPDVQAAAEMIAQDRMFDVAYQSDAGPITPFDILYSYRPFVMANPQWMSHHCGFTMSTLIAALKEAGFASVYGMRRIGGFDLWVLASKALRTPEDMQLLAADFLPAP